MPMKAELSRRESSAALVVGAMNFGKRTTEAESKKVVAWALEHRLTHFDTANTYNQGLSERIVGEALRGIDSATIATKVGLDRIGGKNEGLSRAAIFRAIDASLKRLGRDAVDLYYLHAPDGATPIEETLDAFAELYESKKILSWGVSNYASWQVLEMMPLAKERGLPPPAIAQQLYNVLIREIEIEYLAFAARYRVATTVYNPLAGGLLTGRHSKGGAVSDSRFEGNAMYQRRYWTSRMFDEVEALKAIAMAAGISLIELAYRWLAYRPGVDSILVGPASVDQLEAAVNACATPLAADVAKQVDALHLQFVGTDTHYVR